MTEQTGPKNCVIAGASGFVGSPLVDVMQQNGYTVYRLVRRRARTAQEIEWHPGERKLDASLLPEQAVYINLSGENIAAGRWSEEKKRKILASRVDATTTLVKALSDLPVPATQFVSASAIGIYGDREDEILAESSPAGTGFLARTCLQWEAAAEQLTASGVPVARIRFGVILDPTGGALQKMLPAFRFGIAGRLGSGLQWMSWITLTDALQAILHIIAHRKAGAFNLTAPEPVRNAEFTKLLGAELGRPTVLPLPAWAARLVLGQFAEEALLASTRAVPDALLNSGFTFAHPELRKALADML